MAAHRMDAEKSGNVKYYSLDFWRGVACLIVIVFHSTLYVATESLDDRIKHVPGSSAAEWLIWISSRFWIGVPMFFVISGYCIAASADTYRRLGLSVSQYFNRRLRRIYPPLWGFLAMFVLFVGGVEILWPRIFSDSNHPIRRPWGVPLWGWFGSLTLTETWRRHVIGGDFAPLFGHLWTLCYEEQFYIVVGLLLLISRRRFFLNALALTAFVAVVCGVVPRHLVNGFFFDGMWLQFAAGMAVFHAVNHSGDRGRRFVTAILGGAFLYQLRNREALVAFSYNPTQSFTAAFAFASLLLLLHRYDLRIHSALWARPIAWCGRMCYSLYLAHWPIAKLVSHSLFRAGVESPLATLALTAPVSLMLCVVAGWGFHITVERRFLNTPSTPAVVKDLVKEPSLAVSV
jgi:peptidoglycan/LPS O-acetylase OafA/YrhL